MNRIVKEATIKSFHYPDFDALKARQKVVSVLQLQKLGGQSDVELQLCPAETITNTDHS